jgi:acetylornithine deacetylase/succinyl-diaminopimelate desuccinylase-like protein
MLINEGAGEHFEWQGRRYYGVCCGEKGIFRFNLTARGVAGHASLPRTGDNALLKLGPVLDRLKGMNPSFELTEGAEALIKALGGDPADPARAVERVADVDPWLLTLIEPMLGVTFTPTMASASQKINVIPSRAQLRIDCRVPPGLGEEVARRGIHEVLGETADELEIDFTEKVTGNQSPVSSLLMEAITRWVGEHDDGAGTVPVLLPGFSDSRWFREAFPECVAYGFFPHRYMRLHETTPLVHSADERIDVRDLAYATSCYADLARGLLGVS